MASGTRALTFGVDRVGVHTTTVISFGSAEKQTKSWCFPSLLLSIQYDNWQCRKEYALLFWSNGSVAILEQGRKKCSENIVIAWVITAGLLLLWIAVIIYNWIWTEWELTEFWNEKKKVNFKRQRYEQHFSILKVSLRKIHSENNFLKL